LQGYAADLVARFAVKADFNPEDQLKSPIDMLLKIGSQFVWFSGRSDYRSARKGCGRLRPDMGVARKSTGSARLQKGPLLAATDFPEPALAPAERQRLPTHAMGEKRKIWFSRCERSSSW